LVQCGWMRRGIDSGSDDAKQRVAGARQVVVIDDVAGADQLDAGFIEPPFGKLASKWTGLARRHEDKQRVGMKIGGTLQERCKVWIGKRNLERLKNLATRLGKMLGENLSRLCAGRPVGQDGDGFLAAVLDRPVGNDAGLLAEREARAHVIRR